MYNSISIANYFIKKHPDGQLTPLKLIKLSYIAYGWYLALTENKGLLVNEKPQAWELGPVFPNLYHLLKSYGKHPIKEPVRCNNSDMITDKDAAFLDKIWSIYGNKNGSYLSAITHTPDTPWSEVYPKGYNLEIPDSLIFEHYTKKKNQVANIAQ